MKHVKPYLPRGRRVLQRRRRPRLAALQNIHPKQARQSMAAFMAALYWFHPIALRARALYSIKLYLTMIGISRKHSCRTTAAFCSCHRCSPFYLHTLSARLCA